MKLQIIVNCMMNSYVILLYPALSVNHTLCSVSVLDAISA